MGSSTAYHLMKADPSLSVVVIERDSSYSRASTILSDGNVRIQFNLEENIRMSQYALEILRTFDDDMATATFRPDVGARHQGNLFLADEEGKSEALRGIETQRSLGCDVTWLSGEEITLRFPGLRLDGIVGGSFAQVDGSVDPSAVLRGFRNKAAELGAHYLDDEVVGLLSDDGAMTGARLRSGGDLMSPVVVNCAGAWSADLARPLGVEVARHPADANRLCGLDHGPHSRYAQPVPPFRGLCDPGERPLMAHRMVAARGPDRLRLHPGGTAEIHRPHLAGAIRPPPGVRQSQGGDFMGRCL